MDSEFPVFDLLIRFAQEQSDKVSWLKNTLALVKSAALLVLFAFVLQLLGFAIPLWSSRPGSSEGLWESCSETTCATVIGSDLGGQTWFIAVQVLLTVALVFAFCLLILTFIVTFDVDSSAKRGLRIAAVVQASILVALLLISLIVYWRKGFIFFSLNGFKLDFSWYITLGALICIVIAIILLFIEFDVEKKANHSDDHSADHSDDHSDDPHSVTTEKPKATAATEPPSS